MEKSPFTPMVYRIPTRDGALAMYAEEKDLVSQKPVALMIHGTLRSASVLFPCVPLLRDTFSPIFIDLPGHGRSPSPPEASITAFAANITDLIRTALVGREILVIGESLGGTVALRLGGGHAPEIKGIVAGDPPLTMAKLWHVIHAVQVAVQRNPEARFLQDFAFNVFGVSPKSAGVEERIYYNFLDELKVPALLLTGDVPLGLPRPTQKPPCVLDDVDRYFIGRFPAGRIILQTIKNCSHLVLVEGREAAIDHLLYFWEQHLVKAQP